jgi:hypothetical protein
MSERQPTGVNRGWSAFCLPPLVVHRRSSWSRRHETCCMHPASMHAPCMHACTHACTHAHATRAVAPTPAHQPHVQQRVRRAALADDLGQPRQREAVAAAAAAHVGEGDGGVAHRGEEVEGAVLPHLGVEELMVGWVRGWGARGWGRDEEWGEGR